MYYRLAILTWDYEWEDSEFHYFKSVKEAEQMKDEISSQYTRTGQSHQCYIEPISFEELKIEITVHDFEELFGVVISEKGEITHDQTCSSL